MDPSGKKMKEKSGNRPLMRTDAAGNPLPAAPWKTFLAPGILIILTAIFYWPILVGKGLSLERLSRAELRVPPVCGGVAQAGDPAVLEPLRVFGPAVFRGRPGGRAVSAQPRAHPFRKQGLAEPASSSNTRSCCTSQWRDVLCTCLPGISGQAEAAACWRA